MAQQEPWPESAFDEPEVYPTGESADADTVELGDVTGDGRPDAVVATGRTAYQLVVFAQGSDRSFAEARRLPLRSGSADGLYPGEPTVALGDADGDGDLDAVATGNTSVYYQHDGALHGPVDAGIGPPTLRLHLADLDRDGVAELLASPSGSGLSVYRRGEDGLYTGGEVALADGSRPWTADEIEVGDVNSDGRLDIVTFIGNTIQLYEARADGRYSLRLIELPGGSAEGIEVADLTGDGAADVAAAFGNWARVLAQQDGAISDSGPDYVSSYYAGPLEAADIDGDGRGDLVTIDDYYTELGIWPQSDDGTLAEQGTVALPKGSSTFDPNGLALGDIDCDGRIDAAIADFSLGLILVRQAFSGKSSCPPPPEPAPIDAPAESTQPQSRPALAVRRRQPLRRVRRRGVRAVVATAGRCVTRLALVVPKRRARRLGLKRRVLARERIVTTGRRGVRLKPRRRVARRLEGSRLVVRARFDCGDRGSFRRGRRVVVA